MKTLPIEFIGKGEVKGFIFKQLFANNKAYMYEVTTENSKHYEVFKHKESKEQLVNFGGTEVMLESMIRYPNSKAFGNWAWCISNYESALLKWQSLTLKQPNKNNG